MAGYIGSKAVNLSTTGADINGNANIDGDLSFRDNDKAIFGAGSDLTISHDTTGTAGSYITESGTGSLNIRGNNVIFANSDGSEEYGKFFNGAGVEFNYADSTKLATTSTGISVTGNATFADNGKAIFGAGSDLQIYHTGSVSVISDEGTGNLLIRGSDLRLQNTAGSNNYLKATDGAQVELMHGGATKLATTSAGVDVTGVLSSDGLTVDGSTPLISNGTSPAAFTIGASNGASSNLILKGAAGMEMQTYNGGWKKYFNLAYTGDLSLYEDTGTTAKFFWDASAESLGIGTGSPEALLDVAYNLPDDTNGIIRPLKVRTTDTLNQTNLLAGDGVGILFEIPDQTSSSIGASIDAVKEGGADDDISTVLSFKTSANNETLNEAMRIDSSGNLLVGRTSNNWTTAAGFTAQSNGAIIASRADVSGFFNRLSTDGAIVNFAKNGSTVGSIGNISTHLYIGGTSASGLFFGGSRMQPLSNGSLADNLIDMGHPSYRFDDIYATNTSIIGTSDKREKQDIAELDEAEQRVAVACKGLLRKFRWKDAVAKKGDDARIHFGIIAQDLQAAFAAEGLDAVRYGMFIHNTWWEHDVEVPAVEAVAEVLDEEGNVVTEAVEAKDAYTRTDTYETQEEAPEGAVERDRMGVRMTEILAFIIGAL